jgi:hypothetical protein
MIHAKPYVFRAVVLNPLFFLTGNSMLIPKTDQHVMKQPCAPYWNDDKDPCLAWHSEVK